VRRGEVVRHQARDEAEVNEAGADIAVLDALSLLYR